MKFQTVRGYEFNLLPIYDHRNAVRVSHKTANAVIEPAGSEVRIPFVARTEKGDFKALMDELVEQLEGHNKFRFVGVGSSSAAIKLNSAPDDARSIHEAVNNFDEETIKYDGEPIQTLVGEWNPHD